MPTGAELFDAYIKLRPRVDPGFGSDVQKQIGDPIDRLESKIKGLAVAGAAAVFFKGGVDELAEQQKVAAQTEAALKSTGGAAKVTADQVGDLADELQNLSGKDAEAIRAGENLLLTFTRVRNEAGAGNDIYNRATKAALDLSVALGSDLQSASLQVGKALNDPVAGITALQRAGVQLTASQKEQVKAFVESGNILEAQKLILKELETQVGGSAAAYGETLGGKVERARNALDDFKANVIGAAAPALEQLAGFAVGAGDAFAQLPQPLQTTGVLLTALAVASGPASRAIDGVKSAVTGLSTAAQGFKADGLSGFLNTGAGKAIGVGAAAAGLTAAIHDMQQAMDEASRGASEMGRAIAAGISTAAGRGDFGQLQQQLDRINSGIGDIYSIARNPLSGGFLGNLIGGGDKYVKELEQQAQAIAAVLTRAQELSAQRGISLDEATRAAAAELGLTSVVKGSTEATEDNTAATKENVDGLLLRGKAVETVAQQTDSYRRRLDDLANSTIRAFTGRLDVRDAQRGVIDARSELERLQRAPLEQGETQAQRQEKIRRASDDLERSLLRQAEATAQVAEDQAKANGITDTASIKMDAYRKSLEEVSATVSGQLKADLDELRRQLDAVSGDRTINIKVDGVDAALAALDNLAGATAKIAPGDPRNDAVIAAVGKGARAVLEGRASGGPVTAGTAYRVGEGGKAELFRPRSGEQYLIPGDDGTVIPGAGGVVVHMTVRDTADEAIKAWQMFEMRQLAGVV